MKTVGKQLQEARTAKGWSPEMAARETKIKIDRLHDLEADDFSNFSSPTYARGFVRTYARALGIDEYRILRQLDNKLPEDDNATFVSDQAGVPYMPEQAQAAKPFEMGRGVYIAGGIGLAVLILAGFILLEAYRADYFTTSTPTAATSPTTTTNAVATVPDVGPSRAMPADSNAAPVALPVDTTAAPANTPVDTKAAPRALPVDVATLAISSNAAPQPVAMTPAPVTQPVTPAAVPANTPAAMPAPVAVQTSPAATPPPTSAPAATPTVSTNAPAAAPVVSSLPPTAAPATTQPVGATPPATVPTTTTTPPRALPVDLNAVNDATSDATPVAQATPAHHVAHSLSARASNTRPKPEAADSDSVAADIGATSSSGPVVYPTGATSSATSTVTGLPDNAAPQLASTQQPAGDIPPASDAPSSLAPAGMPGAESSAPSASDAALTGGSSDTGGTPTGGTSHNKSHGKRLVLTASHDSYIRVISLDGASAGQVRYSSVLHSGESISFSDRKYSINVADASAVDIALDGVNYGPHGDSSSPDTFTVESHTP